MSRRPVRRRVGVATPDTCPASADEAAAAGPDPSVTDGVGGIHGSVAGDFHRDASGDLDGDRSGDLSGLPGRADAAREAEGVLVLAGTPLGRISDASPGLRAALASADLIAAEDTRRLHRLAADLDVGPLGPVISYFEAVQETKIPLLLDRLRGGARVVLVTDAGMPSVSDPGYRLVAAAAAAGIRVTSVPGPSAVLTALALSGLPSDRFTFEGFLPRKAGQRATALAALSTERRTMVFFESVHRLPATLQAMAEAFGADRPAALCRELTKTYEEVRRGTLGELVAGAEVRGEVTLVIAGAPAVAVVVDPVDLAAQVAREVSAGATRRDAVDVVAARLGVPRRTVYDAAHAGPARR